MKNLIYSVLLLFIIVSCDEKPVPMLELTVPAGNKTVLIEDFTGISCLNCPEGARVIENLKAIYGSDRIISIAAYTDEFDNLFSNSKYQLKTDDAQEMQEYIGELFSKPAASINRSFNPEESSLFYYFSNKWSETVIEELNLPSIINLTAELSFDKSDRTIQFETTFVPVEDIDGQLFITVLVAESGIIDPQLDQTGVVDDYEHNHVLREIITSPSGESIGTSFEKGGIYKNSHSFTLPPEDGLWVAENCEIIAFISEATPNSKRVLQAISADVVQ